MLSQPLLGLPRGSRWRPRSLRRRIWWALTKRWRFLLGLGLLLAAEVFFHIRALRVPRPTTNLDPPFYTGCQEPVLNGSARANAVIVMLARNSDVEGAVSAVRSVQDQFNQHFGYPWVFLNDQAWSDEFIHKVGDTIQQDGSGAHVSFSTIPSTMWGYPDWIDQDKARKSMLRMDRQGISYAGQESYHHMCRFNSGFFYDHPALEPYKWYWRVEPDVSFTCAITYDPFVEMERHNKKYGYTVALWERGETAPSLFRKLSHYKRTAGIATTSLWMAMIDPSHLPWPFRRLMWWSRNRDPNGDMWNMCHFWSNFEIADLDFFRSPAYRDFFRFLDADGGFYYERWGDAPVHSLAAALLLKPEQVHHFADVGYVHEPFQYCTYQATPKSIRRGELLPDLDNKYLTSIPEKEIGCNCNCDTAIKIIRPACYNRLRRSVM